MYKAMRDMDRRFHGTALYPKVFYPEIYLLEGGYKNFFTQFPALCDPQGYRPMDHPEFKEECSANYGFHKKAHKSFKLKRKESAMF